MEEIQKIEGSFINIIEEIESFMYQYRDCLSDNDNEEELIQKAQEIGNHISTSGEKLQKIISDLPESKPETLHNTDKEDFIIENKLNTAKGIISNLDRKSQLLNSTSTSN